MLVVVCEEADGNATRDIESPAGRTDAVDADGYRPLLRVVLPTFSPGHIDSCGFARLRLSHKNWSSLTYKRWRMPRSRGCNTNKGHCKDTRQGNTCLRSGIASAPTVEQKTFHFRSNIFTHA